jgi:hypothetical protein
MSRLFLLAAMIGLLLGPTLPAAAKDCDAICKGRCASGGMTSANGGGASCMARCMSFCTTKK